MGALRHNAEASHIPEPRLGETPFARAASRFGFEPHRDRRVTWRRAAYRAVQGRARAVALVGLLPVVVDGVTLQTHAGNAWFRVETGLGDRAIAYGLADLAKAGLILIETAGPRRTITLVVPEKPAHAMQDK